MASHINSIQFDNLFDVTLDIESYFSLSLPIPQCILSRDEEIKYWIEYINGQYHDLNMAFGSETNDVTCRGNQEHRLALEIQMRGKKHTAVSEIIQALESIKRYDTALSTLVATMHFKSQCGYIYPYRTFWLRQPQVSHPWDSS